MLSSYVKKNDVFHAWLIDQRVSLYVQFSDHQVMLKWDTLFCKMSTPDLAKAWFRVLLVKLAIKNGDFP